MTSIPPAPARANRAPRQALLVLGMHRSGTSAFTRVLSLLGASLPHHLGPASDDNPTGFWEPLELVAIHDEMLASGGLMWDDIATLPDAWYATDLARHFRERILAILRRDFHESPLFVIKDPRVCRLVPFWLSLLAEFGAEPLIVLPVRHPLEVAASLDRRGHLPAARAHLLWLAHVLEAEHHTRGQRRCIVTYEQLLDDWRSTTARIGAALGVPWPAWGEATAREIDAFLSADGRHHRFTMADLTGRAEVHPWVTRAYRALLVAADGDPAALPALDRLWRDHAEGRRAYEPLLREHRARVATDAPPVEAGADADTAPPDATASVAALAGELSRLQGRLNEAIEAKRQAIIARNTAHTLIQTLQAQVAEQTAWALRLTEEVAERDAIIQTLQAQVAEQTAWALRLRDEVAERDATIHTPR